MAKRICIDAGHGGKDPGAKSGNYLEKRAALGIALELGLLLFRGGYEVYFTRTNDTYVSLADRCKISNDAKADAFISIHLNSVSSGAASGVEVWRYAKCGAFTKEFATAIQDNVTEATGAKDRGVKESTGLYVLKHTEAPAVLVECGFISNADERKKLFTTDYQKKIAGAIYKAVADKVK